jgi:hypothetical protein
MIGIMASGVLTVPPLLGIGVAAFFGSALWATMAAAVSVGYAVIVYRIATRRAALLAHERRFKLLATLDGD